MPGKLYMVATPIGNLDDLTPRALATLRSADAIACEDTRVSSKLLQAYGISKPLAIVHEHTKPESVGKLVDRMEKGESIAYVCDAGTPNMNDPGGKLARQAALAGIPVVPIPGPSALTAIISVCGFPMEEFTYRGFIPHKKGKQTLLRKMAEDPQPSIFLESTHRIEKTLEALAEQLDDGRELCVGRELTKLHETVYRGTCREVLGAIRQTSSKGEFIIVIGPATKGK